MVIHFRGKEFLSLRLLELAELTNQIVVVRTSLVLQGKKEKTAIT